MGAFSELIIIGLPGQGFDCLLWSIGRTRRVLPEEQRELSVEYYMLFRSCWNQLALRALQLQQLRWHLRPKIHHVEHMVMDHVAIGRNMRYFSCFLGEDMVRRIKRLAVAVHPVSVGMRVLEHYSLHVCLLWAGLIE